jgi:DNA-binding transcriptional regulator YdaS (Cro superfamily)
MTENPVIEVLNEASRKAGSQAALARVIGVDPSAITHWKERGYFPAKQIAKIAEFAGLSRATITRLADFIVAKKVARYEKILEKRVADRAKGA